MICKYYLHIGARTVTIGSADCMEVGTMVANIQDLVVSYKRTDFNGVVRSCGSDIEFVGDAYTALVNLWQTNYYDSVAAFAVYAINNRWNYEKVWECPLDFSTFRYDSYKVTIGCVDKSAAALIKANKGTRYHFGAVGMSESAKLYYDRVRILSRASWYISTDTSVTVDGVDYSVSTPVNNYSAGFHPAMVANTEKVVAGNVAAGSQTEYFGNTWYMGNDNYFLYAEHDDVIEVDFTNFVVIVTGLTSPLQMKFEIAYGTPTDEDPDHISMERWAIREGVKAELITFNGVSACKYFCPIKGRMSVRAGYYYYFDCWLFNGDTSPYMTTAMTFYVPKESVSGQWNFRDDSMDLRVIKPETLLNKLLGKIGGSTVQLRGVIDDTDNERLQNTVLLPAEEVRGFSGPTLYSSFNQFCEFMEAVFGYVYQIESADVAETETGSIEMLPFDGSLAELGAISDYGDYDLVVDKIYYVVSEAHFYGYKESDQCYYYFFDGCAQYNDEGHNGHPFEDKIYFNTTNSTAYQYVAADETASSAAVALVEYTLESIYEGYYDQKMYFYGFTSNVNDAGTYNGQVESSDVYYSKSDMKFYCIIDNNYYSDWDGAPYYNTSTGLRAKSLFQLLSDDTCVYVPVQGQYLVKYENDVDIDEVVDAAVVTFKHRTELFTNEVTMELERINSPEVSVANDRLVSEVKIGYEKQDYDLGNSGNDEWNFTNIYTTNCKIGSKCLELISPYRADCYGIEEAASKRGDETTASDSDSDLFIVKVLGSLSGGKYQIDRSLTVENAFTSTVFNATYAPQYCLQANKEYLSSFSRRFVFASCSGNKSIRINGTGMTASYMFGTEYPLFKVTNISVKTDDQMKPLAFNGLVQFDWMGTTMQGYVMSVTFNPQRPEAVTYELLERY